MLRSLSLVLFLLQRYKYGAKKCPKNRVRFDFWDNSTLADQKTGKTIEKPLKELPWNQQTSMIRQRNPFHNFPVITIKANSHSCGTHLLWSSLIQELYLWTQYNSTNNRTLYHVIPDHGNRQKRRTLFESYLFEFEWVNIEFFIEHLRSVAGKLTEIKNHQKTFS